MQHNRVYEACILDVQSTAPVLILNIISCEPAGSDRWSCAGKQVTSLRFPSMLSLRIKKVTSGANPAVKERASAQHVGLLISSIQLRHARCPHYYMYLCGLPFSLNAHILNTNHL